MVKDIIAREYPHETTLIIGDLVGDTRALVPDRPLDLDNMPLQLSLTVYILDNVRNEDRMAALLWELSQLMMSKDIPIDLYTLRLEELMPEEEKPGSGDNLHLIEFRAENITDQQSLASSIRELLVK